MIKNLFKRSLAVMISLAFYAEAFPINAFAEGSAGKQASIQIVHTNDIHGYYNSTDNGTLGFAYLKGIIDSEGADLVLDAGDTFHGQAFATVEQGQSIAELMKTAGYDAVTVGNHDWSYGAERLKELEKIGGFKILASNVVNGDGTSFFDNNYIVKEVTADDGTSLKVGVTGVIDDAFYSSTSSENVSGLKFEEEAAAASETASYLKNVLGCDIVIALTHQSDCEAFVKNTKDIDAVIAGHEHIIIDETYPDSEGKNVYVAEAGCYFNDVGVMEITVDPETKELVSAEETVYDIENIGNITENADIKAQITSIEERQQGILSEAAGHTDKAYPYSWEEIRVSQQDIGRLVTESYLDKTGADIAFENAGGIRAGLESGDVTYKDIISISPYGNVLVTKKLTGKEILDILSQSLAIGKACSDVYETQKEAAAKGEDPYQYSWPDNSGSYLQYSGIEIKTDDNGQIISAEAGGTALDENKVYTVATNNYVAESSDYGALAAAPLDKEYGTCEEAVLAYIEKTSGEVSETPEAAGTNNGEDTSGEAETDSTGIETADGALTRGGAVQMLITAADDYNPGVGKEDIIKGYENGELDEEKPVTGAEALVMLRRAFGELPMPSVNRGWQSLDINEADGVPEWAVAELENIFEIGLITEDEIGLLNKNISKDQMELFIQRVFSLFGTNKNDDFYTTVNKEYIDNYVFENGNELGGKIYDIAYDVEEQLSQIINDVISEEHPEGSEEDKISDFYDSVMDIEGRNKAGYGPIKEYLDMVDSAENIGDLIKVQNKVLQDTGTDIFMCFDLIQDPYDSTKRLLSFEVMQPEMDSSFYSYSGEEAKQFYLDFIDGRMALIDDDGSINSEDIYEFDKKLSEKLLSLEDAASVENTYNKFTFDEIAQLFPGVDMESVLEASGLKKEDTIIVEEAELMKEFASLFNDSNLELLKKRAKLAIVGSFTDVLSTDFIDLYDEFQLNVYGYDARQSNESIAIQRIKDNFSEYIGKEYVRRYFSKEDKEAVTEMAEKIIEVFKERINKLDWMSDETKAEAVKKLDTMKIKVGYPDEWDEEDKTSSNNDLDIRSPEEGGTYFSNQIAVNRAVREARVALQGKPVDKTGWAISIFEVNALYDSGNNDISFPAAFLQKPVYDPEQSYEYNLGSIGYAIAHEVTHAFDNDGALYDENGNISNWWTDEDYAAFEELCDKAVKAYDGYEYAPGITTNGKMTLSENVADIGAVACLIDMLSEMEDPDYDELFSSVVQTMTFVTSRNNALYYSKNDYHAMGRARMNPLLSNFDEFYEIYGIDETDGMYVAPEDRVVIW